MTPTLKGTFVQLEPLRPHHAPRLTAIGLVPELWQWTSVRIATAPEMEQYIQTALREEEQGLCFPFATLDLRTGLVVGSTRFASYVPAHRRIEIGFTWIAPPWQRTAINTEAKFLMLQHAFETMNLNRVELKTSSRNAKSRAAILRLGATEEGSLRQHMINPDGTVRDTVYFSIVRDEWQTVKLALLQKLERTTGETK